jgi:hypothetical protein
MKPGPDGWGSGFKMADAFERNKAIVKGQLLPKVRSGQMTLAEANAKGWDLANQRVAKDLGWTYEVFDASGS